MLVRPQQHHIPGASVERRRQLPIGVDRVPEDSAAGFADNEDIQRLARLKL